MLSLNIVAAATAALSLVSAAPIKVQERGVPKGWAHSYLEDYDVYHLRYIALSCQTQHNTTFFEDCCHPLLANESLSTREDYCTPNSTEIASASSAIAYSATVSATVSATATSTAVSEEESAYCSDEESVASAVSSAVSAATGTVSEVVITSAQETQTIAVVAEVQQATSTSSSSTEEWTAPSSTSSTYVYVAPTTTSTTPAAATTTASSSGSGTTYTGGYATFFYQNGVAGECGTVHSDSDYVVAIDTNGWWSDYASNSNSPYCGKSLIITNTNNGKSVTATVQDACPSCVSDNSLDLSVGAFTAIASESDGMVPITWQWA